MTKPNGPRERTPYQARMNVTTIFTLVRTDHTQTATSLEMTVLDPSFMGWPSFGDASHAWCAREVHRAFFRLGLASRTPGPPPPLDSPSSMNSTPARSSAARIARRLLG